VPLNGTIEVTAAARSLVCTATNNLSMIDAAAGARELTYDEHCRLLDQLADAGCLWLLYTGGEISSGVAISWTSTPTPSRRGF